LRDQLRRIGGNSAVPVQTGDVGLRWLKLFNQFKPVA